MDTVLLVFSVPTTTLLKGCSVHIDWLPSHEAHLQGDFSTVQSKTPVERQGGQAPPLELQTREVHRAWAMLVLPGDNHLLLNSAAPLLLKVNPEEGREET